MKSELYKKLVIITFLFLFLVNSVSATSLSNETGFDTLEEALISEFGENYEDYLSDNMYEFEVAQRVNDLFKENYGEEFPSYYGGMYISDDSKNLILQIVKENIPRHGTEEYEIYRNIISVDETIVIEFVANSYNELNEVIDLINSNMTVYDNNYNFMALDVINNKIAIELLNNNSVEQKEFEKKALSLNACYLNRKSISNDIDYSQMITYSQGEKRFSKIELKPGASIATQVGPCSVGFRTKYNGKVGYVTAGHCARVDKLQTVLETGSVKVYQYENNQKFDYAFVETTPSYSPSNKLAYRKSDVSLWDIELLVSKSTPAIPVGTAIAKVGRTTKYSSGKITRINISEYQSTAGKTILGLIDSDMPSKSGDSGGAIFIPKSNTTAVPIGILSGGTEKTTTFTSIGDLPFSLQNGRY